MSLLPLDLADKYTRRDGRIYLTGSQAVLRMALLQAERDAARGLKTSCFISGYRGSPMHNVDKELWRARKLVADHIHFLPAVNEDIAATSCWGTQQIGLFPGATVDGVFSLWYGKGPGLDRSVDALRHANHAGTAPNGGVLAIVGDDHGMKSTDVVAASEPTFADLMMPTLFPADVGEMIRYGILGWEMSRFSGAWTGIKTVANTLDTAASLPVSGEAFDIVRPDFAFPPGGVHIRLPDPWHPQEERLVRYKLPAALAFARANNINRFLIRSPKPRLGIICSGTAAHDVLEALRSLGLDETRATEAGISVLKLGLVYPHDEALLRELGQGLEEIVVIEEKRRILEQAVKDALYSLPDARRPKVVGRFDEAGALLLNEIGEMGPDTIARALIRRIGRFVDGEAFRYRAAFLEQKAKARAQREKLPILRSPFFCSGCPHSTSTRVPEGSRAHGGVGCHYMSTLMERGVATHTHMGGEGATWFGQAPYVETKHVFQNIGDGTYFHSGLLAIRAAVAAKVDMTYKILFNDAVAMTGGQPIDGEQSPESIAQQVWAEGVKRVVIVSEEPERYSAGSGFPPGTTIEHRSRLDAVQRELRDTPGTTVLIYDQTCAAEKRRRRKQGAMPEPQERLFINERVCEGCGDCGVKSNCLSVIPVETELGRKRMIDQSSCNKDYSCLNGFCPSFVSVAGAKLKKRASGAAVPAHLLLLPEPERPALEAGATHNILVTGIGGTGVVTIGAMITMAAHLEGLAASAVDQFGMAQKGGAVTSHIRLAKSDADIHSVQVNAGAADLVLGCDNLVAAADLALETIDPARTRVIVNTHETITGAFTRNPDLQFPTASIEHRLEETVAPNKLAWIDATAIATQLLGDSIATNMLMLGYAYQKGLIPVTSVAIERAIEINGVAVAANKETFRWGRRAAVDLSAVMALAAPASRAKRLETLEEIVAWRVEDLTAYQSAAYAERYRKAVEQVARTESARTPGRSELSIAVAKTLHKLMAYKDEYEVARLYTSGELQRALKETFEPGYTLKIHLAPPLLTKTDPDTGLPVKRAFPGWILQVMRMLAGLKSLRGTWLDPFGRTAERRKERALVQEYEALVARLATELTPERHALAVELASAYDRIRGYGHVKARQIAEFEKQRDALLACWREPAELAKAAE